MSVDLLLKHSDLLLCRGNRVRAGYEAAWQFFLTRQRDERLLRRRGRVA